jgi:hypothetical protein
LNPDFVAECYSLELAPGLIEIKSREQEAVDYAHGGRIAWERELQ